MLLPLLPLSEQTDPVVHYDGKEVDWLPHLWMIEMKPVSHIHVVFPSRLMGEDIEEEVLEDSTEWGEVSTPIVLAFVFVGGTKTPIDGLIHFIRTDLYLLVG